MGIKKSHYHYVMTMSESQITDYKLRRGLHICKEKHHGTINSKFMKELMLKGYATELTAAAENGKCWYLHHHGVYNQNKPDKICEVFDF